MPSTGSSGTFPGDHKGDNAFSPVSPGHARGLNLTMDELSALSHWANNHSRRLARNRANTPTGRALVRVVVHVVIQATLVAETGWKSASESSK